MCSRLVFDGNKLRYRSIFRSRSKIKGVEYVGFSLRRVFSFARARAMRPSSYVLTLKCGILRLIANVDSLCEPLPFRRRRGKEERRLRAKRIPEVTPQKNFVCLGDLREGGVPRRLTVFMLRRRRRRGRGERLDSETSRNCVKYVVT